MSVAPLQPPRTYARSGPYALVEFNKLMAPVVMMWARNARELFWLAPSTAPPLTAAKVVGWAGPDSGPRLLCRDGSVEPVGYVELNLMPGQPGHLWIGHCVISPAQRGRGLGRLIVDLTLEEAFRIRQAQRVSLMVFPDNLPAYSCYAAAGFSQVADQFKYFSTTGRRYRMLQMSIAREQFEARPSRPAASANRTHPGA